MEILSNLLGLVLCMAPLVAAGLWLVWLSRRPSQPCVNCGQPVYVKARRCPTCGVQQQQPPNKDADEQAA